MPIGFKDYMSVDYKPGATDQEKYNAYKRKRRGAGDPTEASMEGMCCKNCGDKFGQPTKENNCQYDAYDPNGKNWVKEYSEKTECPECNGKGCDHCDGKGFHEALSVQQRLKRSRAMKKAKARIAMGRRRAMRKMAGKDKLVKRARRAARTAILKKLTRDIPKGELNFARRQEIEKRLDKMKSRIDRLATKMFPAIRKAEVARKKG